MFNLTSDMDFLMADSGTPAVITQPGQPDKPVVVVFDLVSLTEMGVLTDRPQITIRDTDLAGVDLKSAAITVTDKFPAAKINKPLHDGSGWTTALLQRV